MSSKSLERWRNKRAAALDQLHLAHNSVGGTVRGRRYATQQINQAYAVLLSSHFQGFCRDLHSECADHFVRSILVGLVRTAVRNALVEHRKLDKGNPNPGNIGADFNRFGLPFWDEVRKVDARNQDRQNRLGELNEWRNAIAHQDFKAAALSQGPPASTGSGVATRLRPARVLLRRSYAIPSFGGQRQPAMVKAHAMSTTHEHVAFRVGEHVTVDFGPRKLTGVIVEDRGAIGVQGRHLFTVDVPMDPFDPMTIEVPEDEIVRTQAGVPKMDNTKIIEYLTNGGLVSILRSNAGGKNQPNVWLCLDNLGNVTHTFLPERGVRGGKVAPFGGVEG